jgi:phage terminase large subunit GpA-like protein
MDQLGPDSKTERVVFMKGAQVGGTECGNNWLGYIIHHSPGPILMVMPTLDNAKETSKIRIAPMIEACPVLKDRVQDVRQKDGGNSLFMKEFEGGFIGLTGANASAGLRSKPIRYLFTDEIDEYPADVGGQGDPLTLAVKRTSTFANRTILMVSTPTIQDASRIERLFQESDQRYYMVPCPNCNELQPMTWDKIKWKKTDDGEAIPSSACLECITCGTHIPEDCKTWMLDNGKWVATAEGDGDTVGYHLNALYSPLGWYSWEQAVKDFLKAKKAPELLRTFINTVLGETWEEDAEKTDAEDLMRRREAFGPDAIPPGVTVLTAGVDTQDDRLEVLLVGWGRGSESWVIEHKVIHGDPGLPETWRALDEYLLKKYSHPTGQSMGAAAVCIDSGGHRTSDVYRFCRRRFGRKIVAIKGRGGAGYPLLGARSWQGKGAQRTRLFAVGVDGGKDTLYSRFKIDTPGPGYVHFAIELEDHTFQQITAERRVIERNRRTGYIKHVWKCDGRNEALDCMIYAMAALDLSGADLDTRADRMEDLVESGGVDPEEMVEPKPKPKPKRRPRPPRNNWFT